MSDLTICADCGNVSSGIWRNVSFFFLKIHIAIASWVCVCSHVCHGWLLQLYCSSYALCQWNKICACVWYVGFLCTAQGIMDFFILPYRQYQKDGRVWRGFQKGALSLKQATLGAFLDLLKKVIESLLVSTVIFGLLSAPVYKPHPLTFLKILILSTYRPHWFISRTYDTREQSIQHTPEPQQKWRMIEITQTQSLAKQIGILFTCFWIIIMIRVYRACFIVHSA